MSRQVLLVDDEVALLQGLTLFLENAGYEVLTATDAGAAMEVLGGNRPEAIVCDVRLPGMTGPEFYAALQQHPDWQQIPFVFLTGAGKDAMLLDGEPDSGRKRVLTKPFDPEDLVDMLGEEVMSQP